MTDERADTDNADEIQGQGRPEQEAASAPREAAAGGARPRDEGAWALRRVLQFEPPGLRRRPLQLFVPHGGPGDRCHGARKGLPLRLAGRTLPVARERSVATPVWDTRALRQVRAVRR